MDRLRTLFQRLIRPRQYWENRALALRNKHGWRVGRTDMYSYLADTGEYVHYAYPPANGNRVQFRGSPVSALRRAVLYAERANIANQRKRG